jgi:hypothetical protein
MDLSGRAAVPWASMRACKLVPAARHEDKRSDISLLRSTR